MQFRALAMTAITMTGCLHSGFAAASESFARPAAVPNTCAVQPALPFRPEGEVRGIVESLGYRVAEVGTDAGCYAVIAVNRAGKPYEIKFKGTNLRMVSRYSVKDERQALAAR